MTNWFSQTTALPTATNILIFIQIGLDNSSSSNGHTHTLNTSSSTSDYVVELTVKNVLLAFFLISLGLSTILGNTFVLLAIFVDFHLRSPTHYLMGSLALADLLLGLFLEISHCRK